MATANVFVLGLDDLNRRLLEAIPGAEGVAFHQLLTIQELQHGVDVPLPALLAEAERQLRAFDGSVDAVVGFWDFPVTLMVPILSQRLGLRSAPLEAVLKCEHKYWSRIEQAKVIDECPRFALVDPHGDDVSSPDGLRFPFWVKPVKSFSSSLAHLVTDEGSFHRALADIRAKGERVGRPFHWLLSEAQVPADIAEVGGLACIAEEAATGVQVTVEGYAVKGEVQVYGVFDSIRFPDVPSFLRFQYPSRIPEAVTGRMTDITRRVIRAIGLEPSTFNVEFFWDSDSDEVVLLEINPRHSQSHAALVEAVDGDCNHKVMLDLALGRTPHLRRREGPFRIAAKWFLKRFEDGVVTREPSPEEIAALEAELGATTIDLVARAGDRLAELHDQDSYSYTLANIYVAAQDEDELIAKFQRCAEGLRFEVIPPQELPS